MQMSSINCFESNPDLDPNILVFRANLQQSLDLFFEHRQVNNNVLSEAIAKCFESMNEYNRLYQQLCSVHNNSHIYFAKMRYYLQGGTSCSECTMETTNVEKIFNIARAIYTEEITKAEKTIEDICTKCDNEMNQLNADNIDVTNKVITEMSDVERMDKMYKDANEKLQQYCDAINKVVADIDGRKENASNKVIATIKGCNGNAISIQPQPSNENVE